jgi:hypothetical protein
MQGAGKSNSFGHLAVLAGLWSINILIVIFGAPFLVYKKLRAALFKKTKNSAIAKTEPESAPEYYPCEINSKF